MAHEHHTHPPAATERASPLSARIAVDDLYCLCCAAELERTLRTAPGVRRARVMLGARAIDVRYDPSITSEAALRTAINISRRCRCAPDASRTTDTTYLEHRAQMSAITLGGAHDRMQHELPSTGARAAHEHEHAAAASAHGGMHHDAADPRVARAMEADLRGRFLLALMLTVPTVLYSPLASDFFNLDLPVGPFSANWIMLVLSTPVVWWAGWIFIGGAISSLRHASLNMSVLVATGVLAAWGFSVGITIGGLGETFFEAAAMLVTFVLFGHWMEMKSRRGTTDALRALFNLVPPTATVLRDGVEVEVPTSEVVVGDRFVLRPGQKVPVDAVIESGATAVDEALVTGESIPRERNPGDELIGGSINKTGFVTARATKVGAETALAQIVKLVEDAQSSRAPGQRLADRAAQYLVVLAVGSGIVTFVAWYAGAGESALTSLTFAISAVVIACPDALGLATPTAVAVGTGIGARRGVLIKDAATLESVSRIDVVVLDKTGTLTEGAPRLTDVLPARGGEDELLRLVAAVEAGSEHPLAEAIVAGARERGVQPPAASSFAAAAGMGMEASVEGRAVLVGNRRFMDERGISRDGSDEKAAALAELGRTPMYVAIDGRMAGLVAVADTLKPSARTAVELLRRAGIEPVMVTGDNERTARAVAAEVGIERVFADVLPAAKARLVKQFQDEGKFAAMVGDGVNDAPALAQADVGIAIGAGTDVAMETARVVLMRSDPLDVIRAVRLSAATVTKMKQNLFWASIYNVLAIPIAAGALYPSLGLELRPEWSALLMSASSVVVATNAVLLKRVEGELTDLP